MIGSLFCFKYFAISAIDWETSLVGVIRVNILLNFCCVAILKYISGTFIEWNASNAAISTYVHTFIECVAVFPKLIGIGLAGTWWVLSIYICIVHRFHNKKDILLKLVYPLTTCAYYVYQPNYCEAFVFACFMCVYIKLLTLNIFRSKVLIICEFSSSV